MASNIISIILSTLLSSISIFIAIRAYKQGTKQIEISNKQSSFNERIKVFTQLTSLVDLYSNNSHLLNDCEDIPDFTFHMLAGNKMLESIIKVVYNPLDNVEQNNFLKKMEDLQELSLKISLLWECEESNIGSNFINAYIQVLVALYKQKVCIAKVEKTDVDLYRFKEQIQAISKKTELRDYIKIIQAFYLQIKEKNVLNILKEQIRLK